MEREVWKECESEVCRWGSGRDSERAEGIQTPRETKRRNAGDHPTQGWELIPSPLSDLDSSRELFSDFHHPFDFCPSSQLST